MKKCSVLFAQLMHGLAEECTATWPGLPWGGRKVQSYCIIVAQIISAEVKQREVKGSERERGVRWLGGDTKYPLAGLPIKEVLDAVHFHGAQK